MDAIITRMDIKQYTGIDYPSQITGILIYLTGFENWYYQFITLTFTANSTLVYY